MKDTKDQYSQINILMDCRNSIIASLSTIEKVLQTHFPEEYEKAIQFYIPQITTALDQHEKWLSRGEYSLQNTIDNILERCNNNCTTGIKKYF